MIKQNFLLLGKEPICTTSSRINRRSNSIKHIPSHDPYIPRNNSILFNCSTDCNLALFNSMTELVSTPLHLKSCYLINNNYSCETIRYNYLKNVDKILFLSKTIRDKKFYIVDCLIYAGGERVCHKKDNADSYASLIDTATLVWPNKLNVFAQDEFICEETEDKLINCDLNPLVPFKSGLKLKETMQFGDTVLLKAGSFVVILSRKCRGSWCGYSGQISPTRRIYDYRVPGGMVYRCYYANKQQVCKQLYSINQKEVYSGRGWLHS